MVAEGVEPVETNRRSAIMLTGSALITALAGCGPANAPTQPVRVVQANAKPTTSKAPRPIGDGSTAHTGPQPHQPTLPDLAAGSAPPAVRRLLVGRRRRDRCAPADPVPHCRKGNRRLHDDLPQRHLSAARGGREALSRPAP
ncbi:exported hypothetical protein [Nostocoides australiense Ben110]|uniref:Uncharacterized protein n=1 Tax=Nostocoides australiense Ben110 TaxID=1193182 RepID=W6JSF4_9MICO|nr:exported hypothetical protein [Tetrasphaera australiensis Ben110]